MPSGRINDNDAYGSELRLRFLLGLRRGGLGLRLGLGLGLRVRRGGLRWGEVGGGGEWGGLGVGGGGYGR